MTKDPLWASQSFWRKTACWVTGISFIALIVLTLDTLKYIEAGGIKVPNYSVINKKISYEFNAEKNHFVPVIGEDSPIFGKLLSEVEAKKLVEKGKLNTQAKNCMGCHTLLGNGAYYAPDLTKAWLDPWWGSPEIRENLMVEFLLNPTNKLHNPLGRRMPNLNMSIEEAQATVAFLKYMSAIDTNGFPNNFRQMDQSGS
ncbi:MAG: cytochrome c [Burkholderiales bacterium]|nr:cytochrome c [Burkholderiales bacterium]